MHPPGCGGHRTPPQPLAGRLAVRPAASRPQDGWRYRARLVRSDGPQTPAASSGGAAVRRSEVMAREEPGAPMTTLVRNGSSTVHLTGSIAHIALSQPDSIGPATKAPLSILRYCSGLQALRMRESAEPGTGSRVQRALSQPGSMAPATKAPLSILRYCSGLQTL